MRPLLLGPLTAVGPAAAASSAMAFHSPQASQRPAHLPVTAPQDWQTKRAVDFAMSGFLGVVGDEGGAGDATGPVQGHMSVTRA